VSLSAHWWQTSFSSSDDDENDEEGFTDGQGANAHFNKPVDVVFTDAQLVDTHFNDPHGLVLDTEENMLVQIVATT